MSSFVEWQEMAPKTRSLWITLGWDEKSYPEGVGVRTESLSWLELSNEEKQAAVELGMNQEEWDDGTTEEEVMDKTKRNTHHDEHADEMLLSERIFKFDYRDDIPDIIIRQEFLSGDSTGLAVWESSNVLGMYMTKILDCASDDSSTATTAKATGFLNGKSVCEIGGGAGLISLIAVYLGMNVIYTDGCLQVLDVAKKNFNLNFTTTTNNNNNSKVLFQQRLRYGNIDDIHGVLEQCSSSHYDYVVTADTIYDKTQHVALTGTLLKICKEKTILLIAYKLRFQGGKDENIFIQNLKNFFDITHANINDLQLDYTDLSCYKIAILKKRIDDESKAKAKIFVENLSQCHYII